MGFKDMVKSDIANVLMNTEEFAESHTVKYDGEVYADIPIILQRVKQSDRPIIQSDHAEGIYLVTAVAYINEKDLDGVIPEQGHRFEIDDGDIKEAIRPYAMGRIVDVAGFLEDYPCDPDGGELCIELEIADTLLPWNDRTFRIRFADGGCKLTNAPAEYHLKMGIGTLSTLLLGYKTAERLFELERIEGREEAVERLDDVLFHKIPYISDYI